MEQTLINRQLIADNAVELLNSKKTENENQLELFSDDINVNIELQLKRKMSALEILELEREALGGIILSVNYLSEADVFIDLLKFKKISEINYESTINLLIGICISKKQMLSKRGSIYYEIEIGDSNMKLKTLTYSMDECNKLIVGDLYIFKIKVIRYRDDKSPLILLNHKNIVKNTIKSIINRTITIIDEDAAIKKDRKLSCQFLQYMSYLTEGATDENGIDIFFKAGSFESKKMKIKFNNNIYKKLITNFNLKIL